MIKFLLFAELDPGLLPNPENFRCNLAVGSNPVGTVVSSFSTPVKWFQENDADIERYVREVAGKYASFENIDVPTVLPRIKTRLVTLGYELIRPVDLDERLERHPSVRTRFFRLRPVIDFESVSSMLDAKFEAQRRHLARRPANLLSQALLDEEVRRELDRIRRSRFFDGANTQAEAAKLAKRLVDGDLSPATDERRSAAIAACARWQVPKDSMGQRMAEPWLGLGSDHLHPEPGHERHRHDRVAC